MLAHAAPPPRYDHVLRMPASGVKFGILRAEVKTDGDALNLLCLVGARTAIGISPDDDCPYLETTNLPRTLSAGW